jgi:hypothetical protein
MYAQRTNDAKTQKRVFADYFSSVFFRKVFAVPRLEKGVKGLTN